MNAEMTVGRAITEMLGTHPHPNELHGDALAKCVEACMVCAATCTACADACLAEDMVKELTDCIRANLDCADICQVTGQILVRQTKSDWRLIHHQVQSCREACRACATICEQHAAMHEHCRICAQACRQCEQTCDAMLASLPL